MPSWFSNGRPWHIKSEESFIKFSRDTKDCMLLLLLLIIIIVIIFTEGFGNYFILLLR